MWLGSKSFEPLLSWNSKLPGFPGCGCIPLHPGWIKRNLKRSRSIQNAIPTSPGIFLSSVNNFIGSPHPIRLLSTRASASGFLWPHPCPPGRRRRRGRTGLSDPETRPKVTLAFPCSLRDVPAPRWRHFSSEPARPGASLPLSVREPDPPRGAGRGNQDPAPSQSQEVPETSETQGLCPCPAPRPLQGQHHLWMLKIFPLKKINAFLRGKKKTCATWFIFQIKKKKKSTRLDLSLPQFSRGWDRDSDIHYSPSAPFAPLTNTALQSGRTRRPQLLRPWQRTELTAAGSQLCCPRDQAGQIKINWNVKHLLFMLIANPAWSLPICKKLLS